MEFQRRKQIAENAINYVIERVQFQIKATLYMYYQR